MIKPKYQTQQIANYVERPLREEKRVLLPKWEYEIISISNAKVLLFDPENTVGKVVFSMIADVMKRDAASTVTTTSPCLLVGVAEVTEHEGGKDDDGSILYLPEISLIQITAIEEKLN